LAIPFFKGDAVAVFMEPIGPAITVQIDQRIGAAAIGADFGLLEIEFSFLGIVHPPAASAILMGDQQIEFAVFIDVGGQVNLAIGIDASGRDEFSVAVIEGREGFTAAVGTQEEVEMPIAVEIDKIDA